MLADNVQNSTTTDVYTYKWEETILKYSKDGRILLLSDEKHENSFDLFEVVLRFSQATIKEILYLKVEVNSKVDSTLVHTLLFKNHPNAPLNLFLEKKITPPKHFVIGAENMIIDVDPITTKQKVLEEATFQVISSFNLYQKRFITIQVQRDPHDTYVLQVNTFNQPK